MDNSILDGVTSVLNTQSYRISHGKIRKRKENFGMPVNGPWIFIRGMDHRQCGKWTLYHNHFHFVPHYCWNKCWKVVVRVTTVLDLHKLYGIAQSLNFPGKVGINTRAYAKGPYLGFFYSETEEECKDQYATIRLNLEKLIDKFDIYYKQKCTEFEISGVQPNASKECKCDAIFEQIEDENRTAEWHKDLIKQEWDHFANMIGDETTSYQGGELKKYEAHQHRSSARDDQHLQ